MPRPPLTKEQEREMMKRMLEGYAFLERERREQVRRTDTVESIEALDDAFESALWMQPESRPSSGLVEMQRLFRKMRTQDITLNER